MSQSSMEIEQGDIAPPPERPILLSAIAALFTLLSLFCAVVTAPLFFFLHATKHVVLHSCFLPDQFNAGLYLRFWFTRWILATLAISLAFATAAGIFCAAYFPLLPFGSTISVSISIVTLVAGILCIVRGAVYSQRKLPQFATPLLPYMQSSWNAQLDFLVALCLLITVPLGVRWPHYALLSSCLSLEELRLDCLKHLGFCFLDLLLMPFALINWLSWRAPALSPHNHTGLEYDLMRSPESFAWSFSLRWHVLKEFLYSIWDVVLLALVLTVSLISLPRWFGGLLSLFQLFRLRHAAPRLEFSSLNVPHAWIDHISLICIDTLRSTIRDILSIVFLLVIGGTLFRIPSLWEQLHSNPILHDAIQFVFVQVLTDVMYFIMAMITILSPVRIAPFLSDLSKVNSADHRRRVVLHHFIEFWFDIFDAPFYIFALITFMMGFRAFELFSALSSSASRKESRFHIINLFYLSLLDVPLVPMSLVLFCSYWRFGILKHRISTCSAANVDIQMQINAARDKTSCDSISPQLQSTVVSPLSNEQNGLPSYLLSDLVRPNSQRTELPSSLHAAPISQFAWKSFTPGQAVVLQEFGFLLIDIPFVLLFAMIWINPVRGRLLQRLLRQADDDSDRRMLIALQFVQFLSDIPALICLTILTFSWRSRIVWRFLLRASVQHSKHRIIFREFFELAVDIPFIVFSLLTLWRFPQLLLQLYGTSSDDRVDSSAADYALPSAYTDAVPSLVDDSWIESVANAFLEIKDFVPDSSQAAMSAMIPTNQLQPAASSEQHSFAVNISQIDSWPQRRAVISVLALTAQDIPCSVALCVLVVSSWRLPMLSRHIRLHNSFASLSSNRQYRTIHWIILLEALEWLKDIIFVPLGLGVVATVWRIPSLLSDVAELWNDPNYDPLLHAQQIRLSVARNFVLVISDLFCIIFSVPLLFTWRVFTYWRHLHFRPSTDKNSSACSRCPWEDGIVGTRESFYRACLLTWQLLIIDLTLLVEMLIIFVTIFEIPYFIRRMHLLRTRWELEGELLLHFLLNVDQPADLALLEVHSVPVPVSATVSASIEPQLDEEHATVATLSEEDLSTSSQVADSNCCSLTSAWISAFLNGSDFSESNGPCAFHGWLAYHPDSIFAPETIEALFVECHESFNRFEFGDVDGQHTEFHRNQRSLLASDPWVRSKCTCQAYLDYPFSLGQYSILIHQHFTNALFKALVNAVRLPVKIAIRILSLPVMCAILISTLFAPFYLRKHVMDEASGLSVQDDRPRCALQSVLQISQIIFLPVVLLLECIIALLPWVIWAIHSSNCANNVDPLKRCLSPNFFVNIGVLFQSTPTWIWIIIVVWLIALVAPSLYFLVTFVQRNIQVYHPAKSIYWLFYWVVTKGIWFVYKRFFIQIVHICYLNRRSFLYWGEILIFPAFLLWSCWLLAIPFIVAAATSTSPSWLAFGLLFAPTLHFLFSAKQLLKVGWSDSGLHVGD